MFISAAFVQVLFAAAALAVPTGTVAASNTTSDAANPVAIQAGTSTIGKIGPAAHPRRDLNLVYAGAYIEGSRNEFNSVSANLRVPDVRAPAGNPPESNVLNFIGLDSFGCPFFLVAGIEANHNNGRTTYNNFWQWTNENGQIVRSGSFPRVPVAANQDLHISVEAHSATDATVTLTDTRKGGASESVRVNVPNNAQLCRASPGWFVYNEIEPPLADFGNVNFGDAAAGRERGGQSGPTDSRAVVVDILRGGAVLTNTQVDEHDVRVRFAGRA